MKKLTAMDIESMNKGIPKEQDDWIKVGMSTCGIAAGAEEVFKILVEEAKKRNISVAIKKCGCIGMCAAEPLLEINIEGMPRVIYGRVDKEVAIHILEEHIHNKRLVNDHIYDIKAGGL